MRALSWCLAIIIAGSSASAGVISDPVVNPANDHTYYLLDSDRWTASQTEAVGLGGNLVTINDAAENEWVFSTFAPLVNNEYGLWIGLNDVSTEGSFVWASGEISGYTNWGGAEPDDLPAVGGQDYAVLLSVLDAGIQPGQWGDINEVTQDLAVVYGVVEVAPEPAPMLLISLASVVVRLRRARLSRAVCRPSPTALR